MKRLLLILFIIPLISLGQTKTKREYYASGKLLSIINYKDGVRNCSCKYFWDYKEWAIMSESNYKKVELIVTFKSYYKNSEVESQGTYKYTESELFSRKKGVWKYYYDNGQLESESIIKDGVEELNFYYKEGDLLPEVDSC
jgi:antitoxin component YwqK of YwqJK toxin-antitoxin module